LDNQRDRQLQTAKEGRHKLRCAKLAPDGEYELIDEKKVVDKIIINESKQVTGVFENTVDASGKPIYIIDGSGKSVNKKEWIGHGFTLSSPDINSGLPTQMSVPWINNVLGRMGEVSQPQHIRELKKLIDSNPDKVTRTVTGVNRNTGNLTMVKL